MAAFVAGTLSEDAFRRYLDDPRHTIFVAEVDGEPAGYAMAVDGDPGAEITQVLRHKPSLELSKLYVLAAHHGSSVARGLMAEVVQLAGTLGMESIWLGVNRFNERANRFYERNGFEVVGQREFVVGDRAEQDFVREKALAEGAHPR